MKRYVQSAILVLTLMAATSFGQQEEPQLAEFRRHEKHGASPVSEPSALMLERAFHAMYDMHFKDADLELIQPDQMIQPC
jgi:hypothetical protein